AVVLVSRGISADLTQFQVIARVGRLQEHDPVIGVQDLPHRVQCTYRLPALDADPGHDAEPLRLDVDLPLVALARTDLVPEVVVGAYEPVAVPSAVEYDGAHRRGSS